MSSRKVYLSVHIYIKEDGYFYYHISTIKYIYIIIVDVVVIFINLERKKNDRQPIKATKNKNNDQVKNNTIINQLIIKMKKTKKREEEEPTKSWRNQ